MASVWGHGELGQTGDSENHLIVAAAVALAGTQLSAALGKVNGAPTLIWTRKREAQSIISNKKVRYRVNKVFQEQQQKKMRITTQPATTYNTFSM